MSQENGYKQALQSLKATINNEEGAQKIEESFFLACISKVPDELRKLKENAYTPRLVSIGPLHNEDKHLKSRMLDIKMRYVKSLICRRTDGSEECKLVVLEECVEAMKLLVEDAKKYYTEEVDNLNEEMLVVDGCFILELLYKHKHYVKERKDSDPLISNNRMSHNVFKDLLLLENQLPFFVIEKLFNITVYKIPGHSPTLLLFDYVISYFGIITMHLTGSTTSKAINCCLPSECVISLDGNRMNSVNKGSKNEGAATPKKYYHILHIVHDYCLPRNLPIEEYYKELMPSASDLHYAGVKFVAGTEEDLFNVKFTNFQNCLGTFFHRACFEISTLSLYDSTELFLRNLIAFEQCCSNVSCYFTSYAFFMDMLVNSETDVKVLQKAGIIKNYLGAEQDASNLFNNLCKEVLIEKFFFAELCRQATKYTKRCWPKNMAHVKRKYFANPWTFIAFCVAFIVVGMSITQFILSFFN